MITRPVDVVRECIENALDAGSSRIHVAVTDGGLATITVRDDGHGMRGSDAKRAVERHTTSKISDRTDVDSVQTLGFRGEALASIATAGRLTITTRTEAESIGTRVIVDDEPVVERAGHDEGTTVSVSELFATMPARRATLDGPRGEFARVSRLVGRYALCQPAVRFELEHNGSTVFCSPGTGAIDAVMAVYDRSVASHATSVEPVESAECTVSGLRVSPAENRSRRHHVVTAVNGRPVEHDGLETAIIAGYGSTLSGDRYPITAISVSVPPENVDVNVHPAKKTVRLATVDRVTSAVESTVAASLREEDLSAAIDSELSVEPIGGERQPPFDELTVIGQFREAYLLCETDELLVIDQHAAHERIIFERLQRALSDSITSHALDPPQTVSLSPGDRSELERNRATIEALGYQLASFGPTSYRVTAVPAPLGHTESADSLLELLDALRAGDSIDDPRTELLAELACHPAVKAGDQLSTATATELVDALGRCEQPFACPHGRPTVVTIDEATLARGFSRSSMRFE